jgi:parvulin-like peptidyl-prolyl isomerase
MFLGTLLLAGCGGSGGAASLNTDDVAVVGSTHIPRAQFDTLMREAKVNLKQQGQSFPKAGSTQYQAIRTQAMTLLVQQAEREAAATKLGIVVTQKQIDDHLTAVKKQYFGGSEAKYQAALKQEGLTDAEVRDNIRSQLLASKLFDSLTKTVSITPAAVSVYYDSHLSQYQTPESRRVRYVLVGKNKSSLAHTLFSQLASAPDSTWCVVAKKYSQDPASKATCGQPSAAFTKGQTVANFDKLVFSLPTKKVAIVNTPQYGWFVLQPTAAIVPATHTPFAKEAKTIANTLLSNKKNQFMTNWVDQTSKSYCSGKKIRYQVGYAPSPDPCTVSTSSTTG